MGMTSYRLCMARPEVGFDLQWSWGSWDEAVKFWWFERGRAAPELFKIEKSSPKGLDRFDIDVARMELEAKRLMLFR